MPLKKGKSKITRSTNIGKLMREYEKSGMIGRTKPHNRAHAREIAAAIAYREARQTKKRKK